MQAKFNIGDSVFADGDVAMVTEVIKPREDDVTDDTVSYAVIWPTNEWGIFEENTLKLIK